MPKIQTDEPEVVKAFLDRDRPHHALAAMAIRRLPRIVGLIALMMAGTHATELKNAAAAILQSAVSGQ